VRSYLEYLETDRQPALAVFRARLGLTIIGLTGDPTSPEVRPATRRLIRDAVASADGYVARDLLRHARLTECLGEADRAGLQSTADALMPDGDMAGAVETALYDAVVADSFGR
jgi:hypothetical protein